jgi:hypothetical protein
MIYYIFIILLFFPVLYGMEQDFKPDYKELINKADADEDTIKHGALFIRCLEKIYRKVDSKEHNNAYLDEYYSSIPESISPLFLEKLLLLDDCGLCWNDWGSLIIAGAEQKSKNDTKRLLDDYYRNSITQLDRFSTIINLLKDADDQSFKENVKKKLIEEERRFCEPLLSKDKNTLLQNWLALRICGLYYVKTGYEDNISLLHYGAKWTDHLVEFLGGLVCGIGIGASCVTCSGIPLVSLPLGACLCITNNAQCGDYISCDSSLIRPSSYFKRNKKKVVNEIQETIIKLSFQDLSKLTDEL